MSGVVGGTVHREPNADLVALGDLLGVMVYTGSTPQHWGHTYVLPSGAGTVALAVDIVPRKLDLETRDYILMFAASLTNWCADIL